MGTMYKETIYRKKLPALLFLFLLMIIFILLSDFINNKIESVRVFCNIFFLGLMAICCGLEFYKCNTRYKYSIIADQLIIHKVVGDLQVLVADIKIKDIENITKIKGNKLFCLLSGNKYTCCLLGLKNRYCCSYKFNGKINKFYFEPSKKLINRINIIREKHEIYNEETINRFHNVLIKMNS
ncbi:hypothetical protein KQI36_13080 [Clostridium senegalense]|uniref:hypothetical protein n=2 Tax=Clostridium senegalense TaxID=1465809 RepID=UPI001C1227E7|nr:hypothetical protein [Clostridium senegalense]MBU5227567.1 hypothetical protein [Clostridium senegalense]